MRYRGLSVEPFAGFGSFNLSIIFIILYTSAMNDPKQQKRIKKLRARFDKWRAGHPANYIHDPYARFPLYTFNSPKIDWQKFKKARPEQYAEIAKEVKRLGVTWDQAANDWHTRTKIWKATHIYY